jgi:hypothetical protein
LVRLENTEYRIENTINPFRAGIVETVQALRIYPFTGHYALMGKKDILWQDTADVLALFGKTVTDARKSYADYVSKEYEQSIA